jgi:hypothetical protein
MGFDKICTTGGNSLGLDRFDHCVFAFLRVGLVENGGY